MLGILSIFVLVTTQGTLQFSLPSESCNGLRDGNPACAQELPTPDKKMLLETESISHEMRNGFNLEGMNVSPQARHGSAFTSDNFYHPWSVIKTWDTFDSSPQHSLRLNRWQNGFSLLIPSIINSKKTKLNYNYKKGHEKRRRPATPKPPKPSRPPFDDDVSEGMKLKAYYQNGHGSKPKKLPRPTRPPRELQPRVPAPQANDVDSSEGMKLKSYYKKRRGKRRKPPSVPKPPRPLRPHIPDYDSSERMKLKGRHKHYYKKGPGKGPLKPPKPPKPTTTKQPYRPTLDLEVGFKYSNENKGHEDGKVESSERMKLKGMYQNRPGIIPWPKPTWKRLA